jgi:hypothetical protein
VVDFVEPLRVRIRRCHIHNEERSGVLENLGGFRKVRVCDDESPDPFGMIARFGRQHVIGKAVLEMGELGDATIVEKDRIVFVHLQRRGKPGRKAAHEKPKQKDGLS